MAPLDFPLITVTADMPGLTPAQSANLGRVVAVIRQRLPEPDLTLGKVAAASGISPRYVQKLLHNVGQGFAGYVRASRLEHCRADLADNCRAGLSITDICFRWGFNDAAHFSRSFRARYGISPKDFRKASGVRWDAAWAKLNCAERAALQTH
jgi:AraC-like DNA-binding protein